MIFEKTAAEEVFVVGCCFSYRHFEAPVVAGLR